MPGIKDRARVEVGLKPLEFIEAHPKLQSLAWPMSQFFSDEPRADIALRVQNVVNKLGRTLVNLRVDDAYDDRRNRIGRFLTNATSKTIAPCLTLPPRRLHFSSTLHL